MHSDPIADMLTRIRNGGMARLERVDVPASKLKKQIAELLKREGYIEDVREIASGVLELKLRYDDQRSHVITNIQRMSRPGLRRYLKHDAIPRVRNGQGVVIMSTSRGIMTDRDARTQKVGGEALCTVW